jgi:ribosomal protein L29
MRISARITAFLAAVTLLGCDPTAFTRPLQEFKAANATLRDAYFQQLRIAREARHDNFAVRRMATLWVGQGDAKTVASQIAARASTPDLNPESLKLRQAAFDALDGYAGILLALASGEDTTEIIADVKGLVGDFTKLVEAAKALKSVGRLTKEVEPWLGPLGGMADLFGTVFKLVSDAARDRALRQSIVRANRPVNALLDLLAEEAKYTNDEARTQYTEAAEFLRGLLDTGKFKDDAGKREAAEYLVRVDTKAKNLGSADDVKAVFTAAKAAQTGLVSKSAAPDYEELMSEMREFKRTIAVLKTNLDAIERAR